MSCILYSLAVSIPLELFLCIFRSYCICLILCKIDIEVSALENLNEHKGISNLNQTYKLKGEIIND